MSTIGSVCRVRQMGCVVVERELLGFTGLLPFSASRANGCNFIQCKRGWCTVGRLTITVINRLGGQQKPEQVAKQ